MSDVTFYDRINTIYQFIKPFLDKNVYFEEYGAFKREVILSNQCFMCHYRSYHCITIPDKVDDDDDDDDDDNNDDNELVFFLLSALR